MVDTPIPSWTADDEQKLAELQARQLARIHAIMARVEAVADEIHVHNMSSDELARGLVEHAAEVTRALHPLMRGPFQAMVLEGGAGVAARACDVSIMEVGDWTKGSILASLVADGYIESGDAEAAGVDAGGNRLTLAETLQVQLNVATIERNTDGEIYVIVRIPGGEL